MGRSKIYDYDAIKAHARANPSLTRPLAARDFGCSLGTYQRAIVDGPIKRAPPQGLDDVLARRVLAECRGNIAKARRRLNEDHGIKVGYLTLRRVLRGKQRASPDQRSEARFLLDPAMKKTPRDMLSADNPAFTERRTLYPKTVRDPVPGFLKSGVHAAKIGGRVLKGRWKDFPIYTLTLEERATCPTTCRHWRSCFGSGMPWAHRHRHGAELERLLPFEIASLHDKHPHGFVVRLHVLGDFYSVEYVKLWERLIETFPSLRVFGYTARIDGRSDPIARALIDMTLKHWDRFAMRFSNAPVDECSTISIEHPIQAPPDAVICPQQMATPEGKSKSESCSLCTLCWESRKRIAFVQHALFFMLGGWTWLSLASTVT